jgi:hypothetical protein
VEDKTSFKNQRACVYTLRLLASGLQSNRCCLLCFARRRHPFFPKYFVSSTLPFSMHHSCFPDKIPKQASVANPSRSHILIPASVLTPFLHGGRWICWSIWCRSKQRLFMTRPSTDHFVILFKLSRQINAITVCGAILIKYVPKPL